MAAADSDGPEARLRQRPLGRAPPRFSRAAWTVMSRARLCRRTPLAPLRSSRPSRAPLPCCRALSSLADVAASAGSLPSSPRVLYSVDGPIATISLNNPAKRNALDLRGYEEIPAAVEAVTAEDGVRYEAPRPPSCPPTRPPNPRLSPAEHFRTGW